MQSEAGIFFGRADDINRMLARLEQNRFLAVVGGSGSGKSSLVRAGLLPSLREGYLLGEGKDWHFVVMRPGGDPFGNLAAEFHRTIGGAAGPDPGDVAFTNAALRTSPRGFLEVLDEAGLEKGVPLLLLVDQFEEIFRFRRRRASGASASATGRAIHEERNEATAFVNLLLKTAEAATKAELPLYVMLTMRSDFIGDCDVFSGLPQAISDSQFLVPRLTRRQMQEVIEKPLLPFGSKAAPDLINQMLNDAGTDPDQLPLMQHALMRTWFAAQAKFDGGNEERVLSLADYSSVGQFSDALSQHLEEAWASLGGEQEQHIAQQLFLCLSEQADGEALIRRMVKLSEVAAVANVEPGDVAKIVRVFQEGERNFIMASPPAELSLEWVLDISHEALLRQWARLRSWLAEEALSADTYRRLANGALLWKAGDAELLRGRELERALEWKRERNPTATWAERYHPGFADSMRFLQASEQAREEDLQVVRRRKATGLGVLWLVVSLIILNAMFVGKRPERGTQWLRTIYQELQKGASVPPDYDKIGQACRELQQLAKENKPDASGFYGNAQMYSDLSLISEELNKRKALDSKDELLASIYYSLEDGSLSASAKLAAANDNLKKLAANRHERIARFVTDNARREQNRSPVLLQLMTIAVLYLFAPICIARWLSGRGRMTKWTWRRKTQAATTDKNANPFLRFFADFIDLGIAMLLGMIIGAFVMYPAGIVGLWVTGEVSETAWMINNAVVALGFTCVSSAYLLFRDAVKYKYRRSFGKIFCQFIPVTTLPDNGAVTLGVSAKRNGLPALAFLLIIPILFYGKGNNDPINYPEPQFVSNWQDTIGTFGAIGFISLLILAIEEFTLAWIGDGRTVLDRISKTKVVRES